MFKKIILALIVCTAVVAYAADTTELKTQDETNKKSADEQPLGQLNADNQLEAEEQHKKHALQHQQQKHKRQHLRDQSKQQHATAHKKPRKGATEPHKKPKNGDVQRANRKQKQQQAQPLHEQRRKIKSDGKARKHAGSASVAKAHGQKRKHARRAQHQQ